MKRTPLLILIAISSVWFWSAGLFGQTTDEVIQTEPKILGSSKLTKDSTEKAADRRVLSLSTGKDFIVDIDFNPNEDKENRISVGNPKVLKVSLVTIDDKKQLVFKPLSAGETTVGVRDEAGEVKLIFDVRVTDADLLKLLTQLKNLLADIEGITIQIVGSKIVIDGELLVPGDYSRLINVIGNEPYASNVINLTQMSTVSLKVVANRIQKDIQQFAPNVTARVVNGKIWLEGQVDNSYFARRAARVAKLYLPDVVPADALDKDRSAKRLPPQFIIQNFIIINPPPPKKQDRLLRITVHFVELRKDYNKFFGFKWQPGFTTDPQIKIGQDDTGTGAQQSTFTATISSLFPKLASAQDAGYARILRTGTVVTRSGQRADIVNKTEIPFVQVGPNGEITSDRAGVGLTVAVTPLLLGQSEDIQMDLALTQINVTGKTSGPNPAPITTENTVNSKLYIKSNESAAVGGLSSTDVRTLFNKDDPDAAVFQSPQTSPLFSLLRSKSYEKSRDQYVIFITPQIVENASDGTEDLKKNFRVKAR